MNTQTKENKIRIPYCKDLTKLPKIYYPNNSEVTDINEINNDYTFIYGILCKHNNTIYIGYSSHFNTKLTSVFIEKTQSSEKYYTVPINLHNDIISYNNDDFTILILDIVNKENPETVPNDIKKYFISIYVDKKMNLYNERLLNDLLPLPNRIEVYLGNKNIQTYEQSIEFFDKKKVKYDVFMKCIYRQNNYKDYKIEEFTYKFSYDRDFDVEDVHDNIDLVLSIEQPTIVLPVIEQPTSPEVDDLDNLENLYQQHLKIIKDIKQLEQQKLIIENKIKEKFG